MVENRLAACANYFRVRSFYRWKGPVENEDEYFVLLKIRTSDFAALAHAITRIHPYEVPCIVRYDIAEGFLPYLNWIKESTERRSGD